jgi:hypothetical protein
VRLNKHLIREVRGNTNERRQSWVKAWLATADGNDSSALIMVV